MCFDLDGTLTAFSSIVCYLNYIKTVREKRNVSELSYTYNLFRWENTPEEIILYAIEKGFESLGFSDHGFVEHDQRYCMQNTAGYIAEIKRLKAKYADKIEIYLGAEEDVSYPVKREDFDYIISSYHYIRFRGQYYPFDSNYDYFSTCAEFFHGDNLAFAKAYYEEFCDYIVKRKPDIIGHFDLVTKFDETRTDRFLHDERYWEMAENFVKQALNAGSIFEVNTGLITRGFRSMPCPHVRLLKFIAQNGGKITLSSDAHCMENLDAHFKDMKHLLRTIGISDCYVLKGGVFQKIPL